jgi:hypothetical protein
LSISGLDPRILPFSTPENAPTEKKKVIKITSKKRCEHCLLCWPAGAKKKVGVEQEKVARLFRQMPSFAPPTHLLTKHHNISGPAHSLSPIGFCWDYF